MPLNPSPDVVFADGPASHPHQPYKPDIRRIFRQIEQVIDAFTSSGGVIYASKAAIDADLARPANTMAWVLGDVVAANNGIYRKVGASGAGNWARAGDLPYSFILASNVGAGTPSAIQVTTSIPVSGSSLILLQIAEDFAGIAATVSFNGAAPLTIKTNSGEDVRNLAGGSVVYGVISGGVFRLANDEAIASLIYHARDEAVAAADRADAEADRSHDEADRSEAARDIAAGYASDAVSQGNVPIYATAVGVAALIIPEGINAFRTNGYYATGDGGGRLYYQGDFAAGALRSADGRWWVPADKERRQYTGQIATRCVVPEFASTTNKQIMTRSRHFISEATRSLQLIYPNWYHNGNAEVGVGGPIDVAAAIEYPIGVFTRVTWGGSATVTIGDLSNSAPSDPIEVQIPDGGAEIFIRTFQSSATGIVYSGLQDTMRGETADYGESGVVDATMGGIIPDDGPNAAYLPLAVLGQTTKPSFFIVGDSRESATSFDIPNALSVVGNIARGIAPVCGFINVARGGERLAEFVASHSKRLEVAQYCSHVAIHMGINDFTSGQTSAGALADLNTIKGYFPTHEIWFATVEPVSTSSDGWLTVANQTIDAASNANRIAFNNAIRAGITGAAGYFDIADVLESGRDSGKWRVLPGVALTSDGTHANEAGYNLVEKSGEVRSLPIFRSTAWAPRFATAAEAREGKASNLLLSPASLGTRPAFKVTKGGADQTGILSATSTRVTWSAAVLNDGDHFLIANGNWRPPKGRYRLHGQVYVTAGLVDQAQCSIRIADNSGTAAEALWRASGTSGHTFQVEGIFETDGTNQFELWVNLAGAGDKTISGGVTRTYFEGFAI